MERLGVKFKMKKDGLEFSGRKIKPVPRKPSEMKQVVLDPSGLDNWKTPMYLMYRNVGRLASKKIRDVLASRQLRYDLTFIFPGFIGEEYNKTHGHFHPRSGTGRYYGEFYEVLSGKAMFLLQHRKLEEFIVVEAGKGEGIFIDGEYGHVTVNIGKRPLLLGNLVIDGFQSQYGPVKKKRGFAYYVFKDEVLVPNDKYKDHPPIIIGGPEEIPRLDKLGLSEPDLIRDVLLGKW